MNITTMDSDMFCNISTKLDMTAFTFGALPHVPIFLENLSLS